MGTSQGYCLSRPPEMPSSVFRQLNVVEHYGILRFDVTGMLQTRQGGGVNASAHLKATAREM